MEVHKLTADSGNEFELHIDGASRIRDVVGEWPADDGEIKLEGPLPAHANVDSVPAQVEAHAAERGLAVCFYDNTNCRTCFCDEAENVMYCRNMC